MRGRGWVVLLIILVILVGGLIWLVSRGPRETTISVFFVRVDPATQQGTVVPVRRRVPAGDLAPRIRSALEALLQGPTQEERAEGLTTEIPPGAKLRGVEIRDGVAFADFSGEVESGGGSFSMQARLWQIVYTATQFPEATRVRLLIEGEAREVMGGEGLWIGEPLARPEEMPRF